MLLCTLTLDQWSISRYRFENPLKQQNIDHAFIRESFTPYCVSKIGWIPTYDNVANGITKEIRASAELLLRMLQEGILAHYRDSMRRNAEHAFKKMSNCLP